MLTLAFAKVSCAATPLLPLAPPSDQESQHSQSSKHTNNHEARDDPATQGLAASITGRTRCASPGVDDALFDAFTKGATSE
jgi:hypothetical protein